jgi:hypothetical protein
VLWKLYSRGIAYKRYHITSLEFECGCSVCLLSFQPGYLPFIGQRGDHSDGPGSSYRVLNAIFMRMDGRFRSSCCNFYMVVALDMRVRYIV